MYALQKEDQGLIPIEQMVVASVGSTICRLSARRGVLLRRWGGWRWRVTTGGMWWERRIESKRLY